MDLKTKYLPSVWNTRCYYYSPLPHPYTLSLLLLVFPFASPCHLRAASVLLFICYPFRSLYQCTEIPCLEHNGVSTFPRGPNLWFTASDQSVPTLNTGGYQCLKQTSSSPYINAKSLLAELFLWDRPCPHKHKNNLKSACTAFVFKQEGHTVVPISWTSLKQGEISSSLLLELTLPTR